MLYQKFNSQHEIDEQYNPMLGKDAASILASVAKKSDDTCDVLGAPETLAFGPTLDEHLEVFKAAESKARLHIFIHGGYWRACSSKEFALVARQLVPAGVTTLIVNYSLCPKVSMSEIVRQVRSAVAWAWHNADRLDIDRNRISISGHSAGGHLVGMLLATDWEGDYGLPRDVIKGALAVSGLFDLRPFPHSWLQPVLQLSEHDIQDLSPIHLEANYPIPVKIRVGALEPEEFHRQSKVYASHLSSKGFDVEYASVPNVDHYSVLDHYYKADGMLLKDILEMSSI
ncbi:Carboxylesterase NlhH [Marinomonas spartinae]|uniref:Carboxylesterase NlhH n=1 Tax=Marinomonas spartinae TaxID=1792290 RepID=A0A1A8TVZ7_9GAMM|nr:alpha/beta hydrolase [Marinomonas spartinae]SBS37644.1 Carboxylesterase NlhH [Marinomonas spartinae]